MDTLVGGQDVSPETEEAVSNWLQQNAIPVEHIEAGNGFADLQPLKQLLQDVRVVGLGETTHGTREIFQLKHRLVEFLVTEMQFQAFTIEASYAACQPINEYLLYGNGDRATVLTGQWYIPWDTEEVSALLDWLRAYNQRVPDEKKVTFHGVDITRNDIGRAAVLDYLRIVALDQLPATETLFLALASEEAKWPWRMDAAAKQTLVQLLPQLQALLDHFLENKDSFIARSSESAYDRALQYTRIMKQFVMTNAADLLPPEQAKGTGRSIGMAENLIALIEAAQPDMKWIYWGHNGHVSVEDIPNKNLYLGAILRSHYGMGYFAFGFEFNQGSFQTRTTLPDSRPSDLKEVTLPPAPAASLAWYLSRINRDVYIANIRAPVSDPLIEAWLATPQAVHFVAWRYDAEAQDYLESGSAKAYDAIIFIDRTTASRPTVNARKTLADHDGL